VRRDDPAPVTARASRPQTRVSSYDENDPEECAHFLIQPDPGCPECAAIMDWRSAHRGIAITHGAEIKLWGSPWGSRHLHMRDLRVAHLKNRVEQRRTECETRERWHPVA